MSRQDIRDEYKQMEGDPHVKGRIRQMQRAAARRRMMAMCQSRRHRYQPDALPLRCNMTKTK
jgi:type III secretory pathway component EscU